jgi:D-methionine transport system permease protein
MEWFVAFLAKYGAILVQGTLDTIVMVGASTAGAYLIGIPLGVLLTVLAPGGLHPHRGAAAILGWVINMARSIPFIILLVFLIPTTRALVGTSLGVPGAIVPLVVSAAPFVARMVEQSLVEVDASLVEAAQSMGASTWQIVRKVYLREALPSLLRGLPIVIITLLGYSAMAGTVGAGGLGDIAIRYGYQRYQDDVMVATIVILVLLVQVVQGAGNLLVRRLDRRMRV